MRVKIVAVHPKMWFPVIAWIIRLFQWTKYSHYAIVTDLYVLDSTFAGVVWNPVSKYREKYRILISWEVDLPDNFDIYLWSAEYSARKYPIMQNIGAALKFLQIIKHNPFGRDDHQLNCSEVIAVFLRDALPLDIGDSDQYDLVTTEKLLDKVGKRVSHS